MAFDYKALAEKIVKKLQSDPALVASFTKDPAAAVKKLIKEELTGDQLQRVVKAVTAKLSADKAGDLLKGLLK